MLHAANPPKPKWQNLGKGLDFLKWKVSVYDSAKGTGYCRQGKPILAVLRVDPGLWSFGVYHYTMYGAEAKPLKINDWRAKLEATAVFNAGQYRPDFSYMGLLANGRWKFSRKPHPDWQGVFVAEPNKADLAEAKIIDLQYNSFSLDSGSYSQVAQSMMLFDATGKKLVRKGNWTGNRTALGEDSKGRILIVVTEGGFTLWDFAQMLQEAPFDLVQAMSLDGGYRSALSIRTGRLKYSLSGQWETSDYGDVSLPGFKTGLPAVIGIFPRF